MTAQIPNQRIEKIKQSKQYQELFATEWAKCVVSPTMIPDAIQEMVRIHLCRTGFSALNLKFEAYNSLKNGNPETWDINKLQIAISIALGISEFDYSLAVVNVNSYDEVISKLVKLHEIISTMFLECEKKCINMCALLQ